MRLLLLKLFLFLTSQPQWVVTATVAVVFAVHQQVSKSGHPGPRSFALSESAVALCIRLHFGNVHLCLSWMHLHAVSLSGIAHTLLTLPRATVFQSQMWHVCIKNGWIGRQKPQPSNITSPPPQHVDAILKTQCDMRRQRTTTQYKSISIAFYHLQ